MGYRLFLDDIRIPTESYHTTNEDWVIVRNYDEFCSYIQENGLPNLISFDHDLADEHYRASMYDKDGHYSQYYTDGTFKEKTGYDCAKWFINWCLDNDITMTTHIFIHSMNPVGVQNIKSLFNTYNRIHG